MIILDFSLNIVGKTLARLMKRMWVLPQAELERGETTNSIMSYMHENGTSEEHACEELRNLIDIEWKKMNRQRVSDSTLPKAFREIAMNMARVSHNTYQYGDGLGRPDYNIENRIKFLLIDPVPIN